MMKKENWFIFVLENHLDADGVATVKANNRVAKYNVWFLTYVGTTVRDKKLIKFQLFGL